MDDRGSSDAEAFWMEATEGLILAVKAQPGARRPHIGPVLPASPQPAWPNCRLKVAVAAAPEDGRANAAILKALADWLGVKPAVLVHEAGATARDKKFLVRGAHAADFAQQFARLTGDV
jgi:uncharacterized protein YggU (UPF0235/DUF167 family)